METPVCNYRSETTVAAHSNRSIHGKGMGLKAHDLFVAFACSDCHSYYDLGGECAQDYWDRGHAATLVRLCEMDIVRVR